MTKTTITPAELQGHLDEQLGFLERSAASFDEGYEDGAKRLAVTLRVLLNETPQSHSLLGQLGRRGGDFIDTALPADPTNPLSHYGLVSVAMGSPTRYVAMLDEALFKKQVPFDQWWDASVFIDSDRNTFSRKQLVLIAANQDGGAHVDPALDDTYRKLSKENSLSWFSIENGQTRLLDAPERAAIRQIAHEVLKTLKPGYSKMPQHSAKVIIAEVSLEMSAHPPVSPSRAKPSTGRKNRKE